MLTYKNGGAKLPIDGKYSVELSFKDGKVKYEITSLRMYHAVQTAYEIKFTSGGFDGYPIYNKKLELKKPETKKDIETFFNSQVSNLKTALTGNESW